jgi:hypothetical protein
MMRFNSVLARPHVVCFVLALDVLATPSYGITVSQPVFNASALISPNQPITQSLVAEGSELEQLSIFVRRNYRSFWDSQAHTVAVELSRSEMGVLQIVAHEEASAVFPLFESVRLDYRFSNVFFQTGESFILSVVSATDSFLAVEGASGNPYPGGKWTVGTGNARTNDGLWDLRFVAVFIPEPLAVTQALIVLITIFGTRRRPGAMPTR